MTHRCWIIFVATFQNKCSLSQFLSGGEWMLSAQPEECTELMVIFLPWETPGTETCPQIHLVSSRSHAQFALSQAFQKSLKVAVPSFCFTCIRCWAAHQLKKVHLKFCYFWTVKKIQKAFGSSGNIWDTCPPSFSVCCIYGRSICLVWVKVAL